MARLENDLFPTDDFVLPPGTRLFAPPGARTIDSREGTIIPPFRPAYESSKDTRKVFDAIFAATRQAGADRRAESVPTITLEPEPEFPDRQLETVETHEVQDTNPGLIHFTPDGKVQYLSCAPHPKKKDVFVALGEDDKPLQDADGKPILVDEDGFPLPEKENLLGKLHSKMANTDGAQGEDKQILAYTADGVPLGDFDVVGIGAAPTDSRGRRGRRATQWAAVVLAGTALLVGGGGYLLGVNTVPAEGQITEAEATNYHLSQFPVEGAAAFAQHYLNLCLTHPEYLEDIESRNAMMAGMAAPGTPENCGWESGGAVGGPSAITFNGHVDERYELYKEDGSKVAYLGFFVSMIDGRSFTATVPVWAGENAQGRPAYSIVGTTGFSAATAVGINPNMETAEMADRELGGVLQPTLETFFKAWADSDQQALSAVLSTDAADEARAGMDSTVTNPDIQSIEVVPFDYPDEVRGDTAIWNYTEGSQVTARVNLNWTVPDGAGGYVQPAGYRVFMVYHGGKWEVSGLASGVVVSPQAGTRQQTDNTTGNIGGGFSGGSNPWSDGESVAVEDVPRSSDAKDSSSKEDVPPAAENGFSDTRETDKD